MRYFIAYKFSNVANKDELIADLEAISDKIRSTGNETFILGRDVKHWGKTSRTVIPQIVRNMQKSDAVVAYIISNTFSAGLTFEMHLAKFLGKKVYLFMPEGVSAPYFSRLAETTTTFKTKEELLSTLENVVSVKESVAVRTKTA